MQPVITTTDNGVSIWSFNGKEIALKEKLSELKLGYSLAINRADNLVLAFAINAQTVACRTYESTLKMDTVLKEAVYPMPHPIESFTISKRGTFVQLHFNVPEPNHNFLLIETATGKILCSARSTIRQAKFRSMSWLYAISEEDDYILSQEGWLLRLQYYDADTGTLATRGFINSVPRDQPLRLIAYHFTAALKVPSTDLDKYSVVSCIPSQGGASANVLVYKLRQFVELSEEEIAIGNKIGSKPTKIQDKIAVKQFMFQTISTCDAFVFKPGESGAWFLLMEKTDVDTSKHDNYYGLTLLRYYCITTKSITIITKNDEYVHNFSIRPIGMTEKIDLAKKSLMQLMEMFIVTSGTVPPKVTTYVVKSKNLDRNSASVEMEKNIVLGSMATNSTSWEPAGRYLLLRGEAGMNGESRVLKPIVNNEAKYITKGTVYSRTDASFSPRGDYIMYQVTKPRFTVDNGIELYTLKLESLASKQFESMYFCQFIPYCASDYAAVGVSEEVDGVYLSSIKTEAKKYVPPSRRGK